MKRIRTTIALVAVAAVAATAIGASAPASKAAPTGGLQNIVDTATAAGQFTTLVSLVTQAGLADTLANGGPFTVFAPTDAAFAKLPKATLDRLAANPALLKQVLLYHVLSGTVTSTDVVKLHSAKTLQGGKVKISVSGGSVYINQAKVTTPDVMASNGVIHVIDSVLVPSVLTTNIVKTAAAAGSFKTFVSLVKKAGLVKALSGKGLYTVFAPTDAAFAKVPKATLVALAADKAKLRAVLLYHVIKGEVPAAKAMTLHKAKTLEGAKLSISVKHGKLIVGGAVVTKADVFASNGVIHVINKVLIP